MSARSGPSEEERFRENLTGFINLIQELITECRSQGKTDIDPTLITIGFAIMGTYDSQDLIKNFIQYSYPYWDQISRREEAFFRDNCANIFGEFPMLDMKKVNAFKELFNEEGEPILSDDDKTMLWEYFDSFIKISIKYIHTNREPTIQDLGKGDGPKKLYSKSVFPIVKVGKYATMWNVELKW